VGTVNALLVVAQTAEPVEKVGLNLLGRRQTIQTRSFWSDLRLETALVSVKGTFVEDQKAFFNRLGRF